MIEAIEAIEAITNKDEEYLKKLKHNLEVTLKEYEDRYE